jgi:hypothetical protein
VTILSTRLSRPAPHAAVLTVLAVCVLAVAIALIHHRPEQHLSKSAATAFALQDKGVREQLVDLGGWNRVRTSPLDDRLVRVSFFDGPRIVLDAAVARDGRVTNTAAFLPGRPRAGGEVAQHPLVLMLLVAAFLGVAAVSPLRSMRNLDLLVLASFVAAIVLVNERLLAASVYAGAVPLAYLCVRCVYVGLRGTAAERASAPLVRLSPSLAAFGAGAAAVGLVLMAIPGGVIGDVAFASMTGATDLVHGTLPYGHLPKGELVHGDTYPLLAYAAYVPAALVTPVENAFDQIDGALWVAVAFALLAAIAIRRIGGWRLAIAWLTFPPVVIAASAGANDLVAGACVAWAAAWFAYSARSAAALAAAGLVKLAPFAVFPIWVARERGTGLRRALLAAGAAIAAVVAWVLALGGFAGFGDMMDAVSFQFERGSLLSPWTLADAYLAQAVVQAAVVAMVVIGVLGVRRDPSLARDPRRVAALAAAVLLGIQLAANYWSYTYLVWVFPLVALALLREPGAPASTS